MWVWLYILSRQAIVFLLCILNFSQKKKKKKKKNGKCTSNRVAITLDDCFFFTNWYFPFQARTFFVLQTATLRFKHRYFPFYKLVLSVLSMDNLHLQTDTFSFVNWHFLFQERMFSVLNADIFCYSYDITTDTDVFFLQHGTQNFSSCRKLIN